ncbi:methyltransferase domain-containing protein [Candidatus Puniceispirillum marinum]|uniref:3-demethylubiquinol 3-O-methyltransferase n=1 Tax=Puniceispirillum marinum (strain IMCC1322) TaxID=488538 RepID=D5BQF2_PUNMI|nr:methyltransferase domain-containing protein [Candidatus Puniceispirillum marinum]ADE40670.1 hypothetical protein SAR116_2427 [Candidatus Puniceispirillum marinum IMCC1322]
MQTAKQYESDNVRPDLQKTSDPTFPDRVNFVKACIQSHFGEEPRQLRILDFGACVAEITEEVKSAFPGNQHVCFEIWTDFHPVIQQKKITLLETYEELLKSGKYDVVIFCEVIEHILDMETAMSSIEKITGENSIVICTTPDSSWYLAFLRILVGRYERWFCNPFDSHIRFFTFNSLFTLFRGYGFGVKKSSHYRKIRYGVFSIYACFCKFEK